MDNKQEILEQISKYEVIKNKATEIICECLTIELGKTPINFDVTEVDLDNKFISLTYETGCRGSYDIEHYSCPIDYLWNINWKEDLIKNLNDKKQMKEERRIKNQEEKENLEIEDEKALLLKLQEKYPNL